MWCCWISPDHNSVSIQRSPRSGYRAPKVFKAEARSRSARCQASEQGLVPKNDRTLLAECRSERESSEPFEGLAAVRVHP
jgi:hypothetical protein